MFVCGNCFRHVCTIVQDLASAIDHIRYVKRVKFFPGHVDPYSGTYLRFFRQLLSLFSHQLMLQDHRYRESAVLGVRL